MANAMANALNTNQESPDCDSHASEQRQNCAAAHGDHAVRTLDTDSPLAAADSGAAR